MFGDARAYVDCIIEIGFFGFFFWFLLVSESARPGGHFVHFNHPRSFTFYRTCQIAPTFFSRRSSSDCNFDIDKLCMFLYRFWGSEIGSANARELRLLWLDIPGFLPFTVFQPPPCYQMWKDFYKLFFFLSSTCNVTSSTKLSIPWVGTKIAWLHFQDEF
jgi:hypothetical protein